MAPPRAPASAATTTSPVNERSAPVPVSGDPNRKAPVTFQCPVALRGTVDALALELECSRDYLINEALRQYVRQRASAPAVATPPPADGGQRRGSHQLVVVHEGERHPVTRDVFVIGRSQGDGVDLTLRDGNVSRKHAQLERHGDQWFVVDVGSTNGAMCNGQSVTRHPVRGGERIGICDHELLLVYEPVGG